MLKIFTCFILVECYSACTNEKNYTESTKLLPNFRIQVEEISTEKLLVTDDVNSKLVSFLLKNVKEIFIESEKTTQLTVPDFTDNIINVAFRKTVATPKAIDEKQFSFNIINVEKELSVDTITYKTKPIDTSTKLTQVIKNTTFLFIRSSTLTLLESIIHGTENAELLRLSKDPIILQKAEQKERENQALQSVHLLMFNKSIPERNISSTGLSCIFCNNVQVMECYDPKNKLIPFNICDRGEDLCFSQHTPFGIVDRGCFSVNHNLTTYVCSCNLCNFIPISEMPYIFSTKRNWIENVIELSRARRLRRSVSKDMSCLRCEVNTSIKTGDILDRANCLEGNVGTLPIEECSENEICGVKAIRGEGYVWRGCVTGPLYNYWRTLCDSDLCNYDSLVSVYDVL